MMPVNVLPTKFRGSAGREVTVDYLGAQSNHIFLGLEHTERQVREETKGTITSPKEMGTGAKDSDKGSRP